MPKKAFGKKGHAPTRKELAKESRKKVMQSKFDPERNKSVIDLQREKETASVAVVVAAGALFGILWLWGLCLGFCAFLWHGGLRFVKAA